jgi:hypothetical protein
MRDPNSHRAVAGAGWRAGVAAAAAIASLALAACGDDETTTADELTTTASTTSTATIPDHGPPIEEAPERKAGAAGGTGRRAEEREREGVSGAEADAAPAQEDVDAEERRQVAAAEDAYADYVDAINRRDGAELCRLLDPSFTRELDLPVRSGSCARRLRRSIGYRDPRGTPVWKATVLSGVESALLREGARVQLSVAIVTEFRDRDQASVESDIAYLAPGGGGRGYVLAKAPGSLWRAVGKPDVPPQVITPPPGF